VLRALLLRVGGSGRTIHLVERLPGSEVSRMSLLHVGGVVSSFSCKFRSSASATASGF
jgi:hypothetical protein